MTETNRWQTGITGVAGASQIGTVILMGTVMAVYVGERGSPFAVGMVVTAYFVGLIVFAPIWGAVADITGRRREVLLGTALISTLSIIPLMYVRGVWGPIAFRALYALFTAGFLPVILTIVSERGGATGRGRSVGRFNSARSLGFTAALVTAGILLSVLSYWAIYLVITVVSLVSAIAAALIDDPTESPDRDPTLNELATGIRQRLLPGIDERDHLKTNGLHWLYVALGVRNASWQGTNSLLPVFFVAGIGASEFVMGVLLALAPAIEIIGMYLGGRAADSIGRKPLITAGLGAQVLVGIVIASATIPDSAVISQALGGTGLLIKGIGFSAMVGGTLAFIGDVSPVHRESELMGLRMTARGVGGMIGPVIMGAIATVFSFEAAFLTASFIALIATGLVWVFLTESHPGQALGTASPG